MSAGTVHFLTEESIFLETLGGPMLPGTCEECGARALTSVAWRGTVRCGACGRNHHGASTAAYGSAECRATKTIPGSGPAIRPRTIDIPRERVDIEEYERVMIVSDHEFDSIPRAAATLVETAREHRWEAMATRAKTLIKGTVSRQARLADVVRVTARKVTSQGVTWINATYQDGKFRAAYVMSPRQISRIGATDARKWVSM